MKTNREPDKHQPFQGLRAMLEERRIRLPDRPCEPEPIEIPKELAKAGDETLFRWAMADVAPIRPGNCVERRPRRKHRGVPPCPTEPEPVCLLKRLVESGEGFVVAQTPEYMEGVGMGIPPEVPYRLHRGDFAIQDHIDLHGMGVKEAGDALARFLRRAVSCGQRGVLVVHGRGLSSPGKPVLKTKVAEWLSAGPLKKWVIAFASARSVDGGAGATYVLLRSRPTGKGRRKRRSVSR